jgi:hypothetical protein
MRMTVNQHIVSRLAMLLDFIASSAHAKSSQARTFERYIDLSPESQSKFLPVNVCSEPSVEFAQPMFEHKPHPLHTR